MKKIHVLLMKIILFTFLITGMTNLNAIDTYTSNATDSIKGIWLGELEIPNLALLRMGLIIPGDSGSLQNGFLNIIDQATGNIPCEIYFNDDTVKARIKNLGIEITGCFANNKINSEFRQGGVRFPILFSHVETLPVLSRPQEPKGPFPYSAEEVVFDNKALELSWQEP